MAGDKKQSTAIKETRAQIQGASDWGTRPSHESLKDAKVLPHAVTVFEDESTKVMRQGTQMANDAFELFDAAYRKMVTRESEVDARVKTHVAILKDKANQVAEALGRINKLAGVDFEEKLSRLERFANAVETLDRLNRGGKLVDIANAIKGLSA